VTVSHNRIVLLAWQIGTIGVLLAIWQWAAATHPAPYLPALQAVADSFARLWHGDLLDSAIVPSMTRFTIGFLIAVITGCVAGIALGYLRGLDPWIRPVLEYLRFIPAVVVLPAALLLFGPTNTMRIFVIAFGSVFPVLLAAIDGARRVDPLLLDVARVNGLRISERLFYVILPAALPMIFAGVRIALSIALVMMVVSELIAADDGLGFYILRNQRLFQTANVYAGVLTIGTIGLGLTLALLAVEKRVLAWHRGWRGLPDAGPA
jgi:ABC-type nitrate/sulfonate/bicarbonate transport system permease component